jgi:arginine exporter protein ArgO
MRNHSNTGSRAPHSGHAKHIAMMAVCCAVPILLLAGISVYGIASQSLETLILLICPIGLGAMMWMMMRSHKSASEGRAETEEYTSIDVAEKSASSNH